jgi:signal transduction histidine kinase/ligand-binding sensor domain-containing protein
VCLLFISTLLSLISANSAVALDPSRQVSQYGHTVWRTSDGDLPSIPHVIAQTTDGYLWIGTEDGLVRFDGIRFVPWKPPAGESFCSCGVVSLLGGRDGSLWIGTPKGLYLSKDGTLTNYPLPGRINAIVEGHDGTVWIAQSRMKNPKEGPVCRISGATFKCFGAADGITFGTEGAEALAEDGAGALWIGTVHGVCRWKPGSVSTYFPKSLVRATGSGGVLALDPQLDGSVLVGIGQSGNGLGLQRLVAGAWKDYQVSEVHGSDWAVSAMRTDHSGGLWVATLNDGLFHVHNHLVDHFSEGDGLSSDSVETIYEDREGNVWTVSAVGVDRFRDLPVGTLSRLQGLSSDHVSAIFASKEGGVWIGNGQSLDYLQNDRVVSLTHQELRGNQTSALFVDHQGRLWYGIDTELCVRENGHSRFVKRSDGSSLGVVIEIVEDGANHIWAVVTGRPQMMFRIDGIKVTEALPMPQNILGNAAAADITDGVWLGTISGSLEHYSAGRMTTVATTNGMAAFQGLLEDDDGSVWGATRRGLVHWKDSTMRVMNRSNGLPCENIYSVIRDDSGALWLYASCGLISISRTELNKWREKPATSVQARLFDVLDGAQTGGSPFSPLVAKSPNGRLWFANDRTLQFVDPSRLSKNPIPPPVHIEAVVADRKEYAVDEGLRLPSLTKNIEIDYTALSLTLPQRVSFRYRLEGHDTNWQDAGPRRQAFYNDLRPGKYRFCVIASNNDGVWNETGASWSFRIAPAYYQTTWFYLLIICVGGVLFLVLCQLRVRQAAAGLAARFDERVAERNRLAVELHDTILQSVQATKMIADNARHGRSQDLAELRKTIESISDWLAQATSEARAALNDLRLSTTEKNDLAQAFQRAAESIGVISSMKFSLSVQGTTRDLHPIVRDEIYRIGSEAIRNAFRHSGATDLEMALIYGHDFTVRVLDNGRGIEEDIASSGKPGHFGLRGMQDRANRIHATLRVRSRTDSGTEIDLVVPGNAVFQIAGNGWQSLFVKLGAIFERKRPKTDGKGGMA